jgi:hypothetical protein
MLIAEHFFLIACDPRAGLPTWPRRTQGAAQLASAALLLDLSTQRRLRLRDSLLHADTLVPLTHPLLADALHALAAHPVSIDHALEIIARKLNPLVEKVLDGLFRRDLLHRNESRRWLLLRRVRYPLRSVQARNEAVLSLRHAVHADDVHGLSLLLLADLSGMLPDLLEAREHEVAMRRLLALNKPAAGMDDVHAILARVRAVLLG